MSTSENLQPLLLTRHEAARMLRIGLSTLDNMTRDGRIATVKMGRRRLLHRSVVEEMALKGTDTK